MRIGFVLASASAARLETLRRAGLDPFVVVSRVDEEEILVQLRRAGASAAAQVLALAKAKANEVAQRILLEKLGGVVESSIEQCLVVGCDSMLDFHGEVLGKPHDPELALSRVCQLSGESGVLYTGHWMVAVSLRGVSEAEELPSVGQTASTVVNFADFSIDEARAYVETGEPLEVAGSFTIDGFGAAFIKGVQGDPHNVVGISVPLLREMGGKLGVFWPDLWQNRPVHTNRV